MDVILDSPVPGEPWAYIGRTYADAPEVDGAAYVSGENLAAGQIVPCEIVAARGYDLIAVRGEKNSVELPSLDPNSFLESSPDPLIPTAYDPPPNPLGTRSARRSTCRTS